MPLLLSCRVSSQSVSHFSTQRHEQSPLQMGTASFPYNVSYHSIHPSPSSSVGPSTYQVPHIEQVSRHRCRSSACIALFRIYSGSSGALLISARIKFAAKVLDENSTSVGMGDVLGGRRGSWCARNAAGVAI